ncbi:MAG: phage tail assembly chaperone [Alphaproteobacteria bacterium]|nr:MAG: phage tail assembly chaperone [Alphaproteobacteria bacterium]
MRLAAGIGWKPEDYRHATLTEFFQWIHGHNDAQNDGDNEKKSDAPSASEMSALVAKYG